MNEKPLRAPPVEPPRIPEYRSCGGWIASFFGFIFKLIWAIPCLLLFFTLSLLMAIPWTYIKSCRPHERDGLGKPVYRDEDRHRVRKNDKGAKNRRIQFNQFEDHNLTKTQYDHDRAKHSRTVWALPGRGPERTASGGWDTTKVFFVRRTWEMYELVRELWRMINRQGLQIIGVFCGVYIITFQIEMMIHDYLLPSVSPSVPCIRLDFIHVEAFSRSLLGCRYNKLDRMQTRAHKAAAVAAAVAVMVVVVVVAVVVQVVLIGLEPVSQIGVVQRVSPRI